jgi:hypothetical protein
MQRSDLNMNSPIDMVYHVQPWMIVSILPFAILFEGKIIIIIIFVSLFLLKGFNVNC